MNKPQEITYETPYKVVTLSSAKQLVVKQGYPCIDGGTVKIDGKFVPLMVRYDNKPELAAEIAVWQAAWDAYNNWFADQVKIAKSTLQFSEDRDKASNDDFSWTLWDGTSGKTLREKSTGREIYQMCYTGNGGGDVPEDVRVKAKAFWRALEEIKAEEKANQKAKAEAWANSPEGKAKQAEWDHYEAFRREMEAPDSDY